MSEEVIAGLLEKRAQIAGEIERRQVEICRLVGDLDSVESALRVFAPHLAKAVTKGAHIPPQHQALRGVVKATIMTMLSTAETPVTTESIAIRLLENRRLPLDDTRLRDTFIRRVGASLYSLQLRGLVRKAGKFGRFGGWELVR